MSNFRTYLSKKYPLTENTWKIIVPISLFIGLFMVVFQPFGLSQLESSRKPYLLAGYGLVTFLILIFNLQLLPAIFRKIFKEEYWTIFKEILFLLWILFTVGLGNLLYSSWTLGFELVLANILVFQIYTLAVGIIPITALTLIKHGYLERKNIENAERITSSLGKSHPQNDTDQVVRIGSENEKDVLDLVINDVLFVKSEGNYITIGYLKNGKVTRSLLRNTMKYSTDTLAPFPFLFQCHRSWIVNLRKISRVSGNSQGLRIMLEGFEEEIPVARNNASWFRKRILNEVE